MFVDCTSLVEEEKEILLVHIRVKTMLMDDLDTCNLVLCNAEVKSVHIWLWKTYRY